MKRICKNCTHWGYNNGKPMNDVGESWCSEMKQNTHACGNCFGKFKPLKQTRMVDDLGRIALPKEIRDELLVKEGQEMEISIDGESIILKKLKDE